MADRVPATTAALAALGDATEFVVGTTDWAGAGSALAVALEAELSGTTGANGQVRPVRLVEQAGGLGVGPRLERLARASAAEWFGAWFDQPPREPDSGDPLEPLVAATAYADADQVGGADPRLPLLVRRTSVASRGWPAEPAKVEPAEAGQVAAGPAR